MINFNDTKTDNSNDTNVDGGISIGGDGADTGGPSLQLPRTCELASPRSDLELKACQVSIDDYCFLGMIQQIQHHQQSIIICFYSDVKHTAVDGLDSNEYYTEGKKVSVYVSFEDNTSSEPGSELTPKPQKLCKEPVNLALVIGTLPTLPLNTNE